MSNTLTAVTPKLLTAGMLALRQQAIMPRVVNRRYDSIAGQHGSTIDVPIPSAVAVQNVVPANTPPTTADVAPTSVAIPLDQWKEAPFYLTDKDILEAMEGVLPMQASEAIKSLANAVDQHILSLTHGANGFYGFVGTPGTTPFSSGTRDATQLRKVLSNQLAPPDDRHCVFDADAEANALELRAFQDASWSGDVSAIIDGRLNRRLGFQWWMDQNIPTHIAGTLSGTTGDLKAQFNGGGSPQTIGAKTMNIDDTSLTGTVEPGDVFTVAGDSQTYIVTNTTTRTASGNAITDITFEPGAKVAWADNAVVTFKGTHVVNVGFHRDAIAFATRPLATDGEELGSIVMSTVDEVSGLTLRLEISREHKRNRFSYDILYGAQVVRRELGARLAG